MRLLSTFRTTLLRIGPQVRNASNIREVQAGGGCYPKNPRLSPEKHRHEQAKNEVLLSKHSINLSVSYQGTQICQ